MRILGLIKNMRFQEGKQKSGSIKAHEVFEFIENMSFQEGKGPISLYLKPVEISPL